MTTTETPTSGLDPEAEGLSLPQGLELLNKVGTGRAATVYEARYQGETVALKAYKRSAADWYRKRIDKNIAVFEMMQNRRFRSRPELVDYTAKPIRVIGQDGQHSLCFVQEYVDGLTLEQLGERQKNIPGYLLHIGETIARTCESHKLRGVDEFMKGVKFREGAGGWSPVMFDFKHIPQEQPKESKESLLSRLGLSRKSPLSPGFLGEWEALQRRLG